MLRLWVQCSYPWNLRTFNSSWNAQESVSARSITVINFNKHGIYWAFPQVKLCDLSWSTLGRVWIILRFALHIREITTIKNWNELFFLVFMLLHITNNIITPTTCFQKLIMYFSSFKHFRNWLTTHDQLFYHRKSRV
jgi:hypothetical protein